MILKDPIKQTTKKGIIFYFFQITPSHKYLIPQFKINVTEG